ncbi:lipoprotein [Photobacterium sp. SDRW27]|uniref:lipoprotein n=1 Tax=Photobacterium obscurum TaxID=2829490 RepID=UPI002244E7A1|nr:lipoprotein [Photobacterium obscurum]MCW8332112.1 lipoprotein [Photobacterium obscurum]
MKKIILAATIATLLAGCNGGDNNNNTAPINPDVPATPVEPSKPVPPSNEFRGTAAAGSAIRGELTVIDSNANSMEYVTAENGKFSFLKDDIVAPAMIKIEGAAGGSSHEVYSIVLDGKDVANVTPLTELLISRVTGKQAKEVFDNFDLYQTELTPEALEEAQVELKSVINPLLVAAGVPADFDLIWSEFDANYRNIDSVLDLINIRTDENGATVEYKGDSGYFAELRFNENWKGKTLSKGGIELLPEDAAEAVTYVAKADLILESMAIEKNESEYLKVVHSGAFWYGQPAENMFEQKESMYPNETSEMNRFKDFAITDIEDDGSYLLAYTVCYEDSAFASCGREKAWFAMEAGEIKFMGRKDDMPFNVSTILIARQIQGNDNNPITWSVEIDAFPDANTVCGIMPDEYNNTAWYAGVPQLGKLSDFTDVEKVTLTGIGERTITMDSVYKEVSESGTITACHLVDSSYGYKNWQGEFMPYSLVIDGVKLDDDEFISDNNKFLVEYFKKDSGNSNEEISIGKGMESDEAMSKYFAQLDRLVNEDGNFYMSWTRESQLVTDIDAWATEVGQFGSKRVPVINNANEVSTDKLDKLKSVYLASFDNHGRAISSGFHFSYD